MGRQAVKRMWVIEYVNGWQFLGRWNNQWTRSSDVDAAALFQTESEAENARQSLLAEASDRLGAGAAPQFWYDMHGGLVLVREVTITTNVVESAQP